jgi:hypothetical protein
VSWQVEGLSLGSKGVFNGILLIFFRDGFGRGLGFRGVWEIAEIR